MANTKVPIELSSTPGIVDNSTATAITIDGTGAATFTGNVNLSTGKLLNMATSGAITFNGLSTQVYESGGSLFLYTGSANALTIAPTGAATFSSTLTAQKLVSTNGVLELDDNGSHNGIINSPASLFINIDSDNGATGEDFIIGKDRNGTSGGTELFRVQEDGNVGIGVTPSAWFSVYKGVSFPRGSSIVGRTDDPTLDLQVNGYRDASATWRYIESDFATLQVSNSGAHRWYNAVSGAAGGVLTWVPRMTLDESGNLLVGQTAKAQTAVGFSVTQSGIVSTAMVSASSADNSYHLYSTGAATYRFYVGLDGKIHAGIDGIAVISDATLKHNIRDLETGLSEIMALQPRRFDWISEADGDDVAGFIAQEVELVLPELVSDYMYTEEVTKKSVRSGAMIPVIVKAMQEQQALIQSQATSIEALTARLEALEGA